MMSNSDSTKSLPLRDHINIAKLRGIQITVFSVGLAAMIVAGWYLIEGMLHFAGDDASKRVFIAAGIIFQITESICFIGAAALNNSNIKWRSGLFLMGCLLFLFSITVMTLAQKATLQAGEHEADALQEQITAIKSQTESLNEMISSYRLNAEKQSKSIFANSRELGQDSLNRATELEHEKLRLTQELFTLNNQRRQTSSQFFQQLESITNIPALQSEFYFLVSRSVLLELCGILLLAFSAHLKISPSPKPIAANVQKAPPPKKTKIKETMVKQTPEFNPTGVSGKFVSSGHWASSHIRQLKQQTEDEN